MSHEPLGMSDSKNKPLMRSLGEFVGHIYRAVKANPSSRRAVVNKKTEERNQGNITLRRTTIEEIEIHETKNPDG